MNLQERIKVVVQLGEHLKGEDEYLEAVMHRTQYNNAWFTIDNQKRAVAAIAEHFLSAAPLQQWLEKYDIPAENEPKTVGLVMAGNIPLVGFHDWLCVFLAGHKAKVKLSEKDAFLMPYLFKLLGDFDERTRAYTEVVNRLEGFDAVIATGSNNSARYFESYFSKYPHVIRKNRNGIAVLTGEESQEELLVLGKDVFDYFGLGCRNVSKIYVPQDYDFTPLMEALHEYRKIVMHSKYKNNFDYNYALFVLNRTTYKANGCIILREDPSIQSRIATLHYEYYQDIESVSAEIQARTAEIQCVVAQPNVLNDIHTFGFGKAQQPALDDYADGVDTMSFLLSC
jgi:hypothetical protein